MKKVVVFVGCLLIVFASSASFFAASCVNKNSIASVALGEVNEAGTGDTGNTLPSGVTLWYQDEIAEGARRTALTYNPSVKNYIKYHGDFGAYYNTTGYLTFGIDEGVEDRISDLRVNVMRLGDDGDDNWHGDMDLLIDVQDTNDDEFRDVYYWNYYAWEDYTSEEVRSIGIYQITVSIMWLGDVGEPIWYWHTSIPGTCWIEHDPTHENCPEGCEQEIEYFNCEICQLRYDHEGCEIVDCEVCKPKPKESELREYIFYSVCRSYDSVNYSIDTVPNFGATFTSGNKAYVETDSLAAKTKFQVRLRSRDSRLYWNEGAVTYKSDCDLLKDVDGGGYLELKVPKAGVHTLKFTVTFDFVHVDATGAVAIERGRTEEIELRVDFYPRQNLVDIWDVFVGAGILAALGVAAWFVTKLSRHVELVM